MIYTQKIQHAIRFAIKTHEDYQKQKRKGKDVPYITHPLTVGLILASAGSNEDLIISGILHDTIEDSVPEKKVNKEMITERFGENIYELVLSVTEQNKELPWEERKAEALEHLKTFSNDSLLLKSADLIANVSEIIDDYKKNGEETFKRFNSPKEKLIQNYLQAINIIIKQWTESPLVSDLAEIRIQLMRIDALETGHLAYIEWNIYFIEYEIERILQNFKVKIEVLKLCEDMHQVFREYESCSDINQLDKQLTKNLSSFRKIVQDIEEDDKEFGMYFLLISHIPDMMTSQSKFMDLNLKVKQSEIIQGSTNLYFNEEQQKERKIVFVQCEEEEGGCGFIVEFKYPNCTFFFCKEHKMGFNIDLNTVTDAECKQHGKMERYNVLVEDNVCPVCEKNILAILSTGNN